MLAIGLVTVFFVSCKKTSSGAGNMYPKQVFITYRVTSAAIDSVVLITYDNETGGKNTVDNPRLPFTKTIARKVNRYENITVGYFLNPAKPVTMDILVGNKLVKSQDNNSPNAAMTYTFE
jgi:hypothetical protein